MASIGYSILIGLGFFLVLRGISEILLIQVCTVKMSNTMICADMYLLQ